ncbi:MAG: hypothetical protein CMP15_02900 [Rickettsiales bacterium]|nr:hypothetical protein [Pelagibacterales bacterium]MBT35186.1 hypothetical protein [Rickettsiales bacterium]|tara:strand:- start:1670 stop:2041 length:372 start_codon:yes stop_codon:yes gene_type:complete
MKKNKLSIIIHTNSDEKINYALSISAVAAAIDRKVELFFAGETVNNLVSEDILNAKNKHSKLTFSNSGELLNANKELNTRFLICSGALNENKIKKEDLRDDIKWNITGITEIIADDNSQIIFI